MAATSSAAATSSSAAAAAAAAASSSAAMDWYHDAMRGVATTAGVRAVGGGGVLPPQAPQPPRFGVPPRYDEFWSGGHPRPPPPSVSHPRPPPPPVSHSRPPPPPVSHLHPTPLPSGHPHPPPPYSSFQVSEAMEEQTSSEPLDPLSHEEFLHMSNFDGMEQERYYTNLINDKSNHFESSEMGSQYADEQDPIGNENAALRPNQKRSKNFSLEDNLLVPAWINVSFDAVQGTDQSRGTYWGRIYEYFHDNKEFDSDRSQRSLVHRWSTIQEQVNKYTGYLCQIQNRNQSGVNPEDMHVQAAMMYKKKEEKKCVMILKYACEYLKTKEICRKFMASMYGTN
ncbi:uncharacterized protein [Oryza sativa Japonica Group]|uniref:uncharacterized protein n=1 Tax=Oryza sativa subsp. japonica TaxID=39947 RepID=UPI00339BED26